MKNSVPFLISMCGLLATGCASSPRAMPHTTVTPPAAAATTPEPAATTPAAATVTPDQAPAPAAVVSRVFELPGKVGAGTPREVKMLVELPELKVATIILRRGTVLPPHNSRRHVTIVALQGAGTVTAGPETFRIDATHAVLLAPGVQHDVTPDANTDLVLLVQHAGQEQAQN
ncbi:MAG: AraC family ligand binding domain-containing protein [Kofleriaceae bacterium]|nr:AraC family ligand binding domain-containing protein [Kofleriaceae bacterium]